MEAVILAGGKGTRLRSVVSDVPKPLAPVGARPFLTYLLDRLSQFRFDKVILSVGYMAEAFSERLGGRYGNVTLDYVVEREPLDTGGGLRKALAHAGSSPVLVLNGDTFMDIDYEAMLATHRGAEASLTVCVRHVDNAGRYGRVVIDDGRVIGFEAAGKPVPGYISCGVYIVDRELLVDPGLPKRFSFEKEFLEPRIASLRPCAYVASGYFVDIGVPEDYERAQHELALRVMKQ